MDLDILTISAGNGWMKQEERFSGNIAGKEQKNYTLLHKGELSYNHGNSKLAKYGAVFSLQNFEEALVPRVYHSFKMLSGSAKFIEYYFATKLPDRELGKLISSGARMDGLLNIKYDDFMGIKLTIPSEMEQHKISTFFSKLDNTITLQQRKLNSLQKLKKGLLQKMFPKKGENIPEIRFPKFSDAWKQRKVDDIANRFDNLRVPVAENERHHGNIPYYGANGIQDYVEGFTHDGEFILVAEDGANDLVNYPVQYVNGKIWVNNHAHVLQGKEHIDTKFLKYAFQTTNIGPYLVGGGRSKLNADVMMQILLNIPEEKEQIRVSNFIFEIENNITLQQRKLESLQKLKKGLLQQMFI